MTDFFVNLAGSSLYFTTSVPRKNLYAETRTFRNFFAGLLFMQKKVGDLEVVSNDFRIFFLFSRGKVSFLPRNELLVSILSCVENH